MNHPVIASMNGNERHMHMIKEAEKYRRIKAISRGRPKKDDFAKLWKNFTSLVSRDVEKAVDPAA
ncbi:MAG: hypothetical protein KAI94_08590 [Anaerolineales bacterium]|jgi:hypothetical protein|nr:hypothetical protein [Anaerolineales bacterium]